MKTVLTLLMLPAIVLIYVLSAKSYIDGQYVAAYSLMLGWLLSTALWIRSIGLVFQNQKQAVTLPAKPRAYITK